MNNRVTLGERFRRTFIRRTASGRYIPEIDGLRFPAIAIVVTGHLSSFFLVRGGYAPPRSTIDRIVAAPERYASEGVCLFFIISGFILALPFAFACCGGGSRVSLRAYFLRRLTRLEPPYLITLLALAVVEVVAASHHIAGRTGTPQEIISHAAASAVYLHNLIFGSPSTINPPAWSLEIEVQFYVLVPLLATVFFIRSMWVRRAVILGIAVCSMVAEVTLGDAHPRISLSLIGQLQFFFLGFLLADSYVFGGLRGRTVTALWDVISLGAWALVFWLWQRSPIAMMVLPFLALIAFVGAFRGRLSTRLFSNPWITTLGGMCYSIYLVHFELIAAMGRATRQVLPASGVMWQDFIMHAPFVLAIVLTCSMAFFYFIERPCMDPRWPRNLAARLGRAAATVEPGTDHSI